MEELTNVHDAMDRASLATQYKADKVISVRVEEQTYSRVRELCERHGTNVSEFLRQCCLGLIQDYQAPKAE